MIEQFYTHAKHTFTDLEKIQIYLAQVQGMILGIITHLGNKETLDNFVGDDDIKSNITIAHLTTITYSSETGELVKDALEILFLETNEVCKSITTDEVGATFIIELNYGEKEIIKYSMRNKLGSIELKNYV